MRKSILCFICCISLINFNNAQIPIDLKKGGYFNFKSIQKNSPDVNYNFLIKRRSNFDIKMVAGNDYKISSDSPGIKMNIRKDIWSIYNGDTLYINGLYVNGYSHYCKVENQGHYLYLQAGIPKRKFYKKYGFKRSMIDREYFPIGGAIGGAISGAQLAMVRFYYILDSNSGEITLLSKENLLTILSQDAELKKAFLIENPNYNPDLFLKYIDNLNKKF